jgi:hypothetical protein
LEKSIKTEIQKWKKCFKWHGWSPLFESDQFALLKTIEGVPEPNWEISRHEFLKSLSETEINIVLTGDREQIFLSIHLHLDIHIP